MVLQQFKSYENLRKSQNATASNAYFNNRSSLNSQLNINLASSQLNINPASSQDNAFASFIKGKNRDSIDNTTAWGGRKTQSGYGSGNRSVSHAAASSQNAITKFDEMTGGFGFLTQVGKAGSRKNTPYQA